jgi:hypothetical protein
MIAATYFLGVLYQLIFNHVTHDDYNQYLSWGLSSPDSWDVYLKRETSSRHSTAIGLLIGGVVASAIGKALQYIFGGTWKFKEDFLDRLK